MIAGDQVNARTGRKLKSRALVMFTPMIHMVEPYRRQGFAIACFGEDSHYFEDGACPHVELVFASLKTDWHRSRTWFKPFGESEYQRAGVAASSQTTKGRD